MGLACRNVRMQRVALESGSGTAAITLSYVCEKNIGMSREPYPVFWYLMKPVLLAFTGRDWYIN